jgi:hypothetical protein
MAFSPHTTVKGFRYRKPSLPPQAIGRSLQHKTPNFPRYDTWMASSLRYSVLVSKLPGEASDARNPTFFNKLPREASGIRHSSFLSKQLEEKLLRYDTQPSLARYSRQLQHKISSLLQYVTTKRHRHWYQLLQSKLTVNESAAQELRSVTILLEARTS